MKNSYRNLCHSSAVKYSLWYFSVDDELFSISFEVFSFKSTWIQCTSIHMCVRINCLQVLWVFLIYRLAVKIFTVLSMLAKQSLLNFA